MPFPRVLQITAFDQLPDDQVDQRIQALGALAPDQRSGFGVQLRDPGSTTADLWSRGRGFRLRTRQVGASLIVNDRLDLAVLLEADGVHLGRHSVTAPEVRTLLGDSTWISMSAHSMADVERAAALDIQAVVLSPIFGSPGKGEPLGLPALEQARTLLPSDGRVALIALGGVTAERSAQCLASGADGVASIRADLTGVLAG